MCMQVRIINCSCDTWWHKDYIGREYSVIEYKDYYFVPGVYEEIEPYGAILPKGDCIII